jgi:hypothetical protein
MYIYLGTFIQQISDIYLRTGPGAGGVLSMVSGGNQSTARRGGHVKILHINDHHSYIEGDVFKLDTSTVLKGTRQVLIRMDMYIYRYIYVYQLYVIVFYM